MQAFCAWLMVIKMGQTKYQHGPSISTWVAHVILVPKRIVRTNILSLSCFSTNKVFVFQPKKIIVFSSNVLAAFQSSERLVFQNCWTTNPPRKKKKKKTCPQPRDVTPAVPSSRWCSAPWCHQWIARAMRVGYPVRSLDHPGSSSPVFVYKKKIKSWCLQ